MPWFKKKQNPIDRRLQELGRQIADLESQARKRQEEELRRQTAESLETPKTDGQGQAASTPRAEEPKSRPPQRPRFRTTVTPKGIAPIHGIEPHEVDFFARQDRPVDFGLESGPAGPSKTEARKGNSPSQSRGAGRPAFLDSILQWFGKPKPPAPEERLVSYLTTGSFQRLKPLRYEKRVARNRLIIVIALLVVFVFLVVKFITR